MTDAQLIASHLRDFAEFLPPEKREDFNATVDDLQREYVSRDDVLEEAAMKCIERAANCGSRALPKSVGEVCASAIRGLKAQPAISREKS